MANLRRVVKLPQNFLNALLAYVVQYGKNLDKKVFPFGSENIHNFLNRLFEEIEITRIRNGLRHTAASFHLAKTKNSIFTAEQFGSSPTILVNHYTGMVSNRECERFFNLDLTKDVVS